MVSDFHKSVDVYSERTGTVWVLGLAFFLSGVLGILAAGALDGNNFSPLYDYVMDYLELLRNDSLNDIGRYVLLRRCLLFLVLLSAGLTRYGCGLARTVLVLYGFFSGLSGTLLLLVFGHVGLVLAFILLLLPGIPLNSALFLLSSISGVGQMAAAGRKDRGSFRRLLFRYVLCCVLLILLLCVESCAVPFLLRLVAEGTVLRM